MCTGSATRTRGRPGRREPLLGHRGPNARGRTDLAPVVSIATGGVGPREAGAASGVLNRTRQIGASLGLAVLGTAAGRTGHATTVGALDCGCALRMLVGAGVLVLAILVAIFVLPRPTPVTAGAGPTP